MTTDFLFYFFSDVPIYLAIVFSVFVLVVVSVGYFGLSIGGPNSPDNALQKGVEKC